MVMHRQKTEVWKQYYANTEVPIDQWNNSTPLQPSIERYELEVIGNIYENPEITKEWYKIQ
jgi:hypothetical protein